MVCLFVAESPIRKQLLMFWAGAKKYSSEVDVS